MADYAACHAPGSLSIPLRAVFATWLGWLAPPDRPIVVVRGADQDPEEVGWQAAKVGYDNIAGELAGGLDAWASSGMPTAETALVTVEDLAGRVLVDVRQRAEFAAGHVPGALNLELGDLVANAAELPAKPLVVMCAHGDRAVSAASVLEGAGRRDVVILPGGAQAWAAAGHGGRLATGS